MYLYTGKELTADGISVAEEVVTEMMDDLLDSGRTYIILRCQESS